MPTISDKNIRDPYRGYNFWIEWKGIVHAGFRECSGLNATRAVGEYREGTDKTLGKRKVPGLTSHGNITLKRGIADNNELWEWHNLVQTGNKDFRKMDVAIILANDLGEPQVRWELQSCWPTTWTGPDLNATSDEVAIESLELVHEGIVKK